MRLCYYIFGFLELNLLMISLLQAADTASTATTTAPEPTALLTTVTTEWLTKQQQNVTTAQASLTKERQAWSEEEKKFQQKMTELDNLKQPVTEDMFKPVTAEKDLANKEVEKWLAERQQTQNQLDKFQQTLKDLQQQLEKWLSSTVTAPALASIPAKSNQSAAKSKSDQTIKSATTAKASPTTKSSEKPTAKTSDSAKESTVKTHDQEKAAAAQSKAPVETAVAKSTTPSTTTPTAPPDAAVQAASDSSVNVTPAQIEETKTQIALLSSAITVQTSYLKIVEERYQLATQRLTLTIQWYNKLNALSQQQQLAKRQETIKNAKATLTSNQEALLLRQKELPDQVARLETTQLTAEQLREMLNQASLDKDTITIEIENSKLESQNLVAALDSQQKMFQEQQQQLETLRKTALADPAQKEVQDQIIAGRDNDLKVQEQQLKLAQENIDVTKQRLEQLEKQLPLTTEWYQKLQTVYQQRQQQFLELQTQQEQQKYFSQALEFRKQLEVLPPTAPASQREWLTVQIQQAKEQAEQVKRRLQISQLEEQLQQWQTASQQKTADANVYQTLAMLQGLLTEMGQLFNDLKQLQETLTNKLQAVAQQLEMSKKRTETLTDEAAKYGTESAQILTNLTTSFGQELAKIPQLQINADELQKQLETAYKETLQQSLFRVRQLPKEATQWQSLFTEGIKPLPMLFGQQVQLTWQGLLQAFQQTTTENWQIFSVTAFGWLVLLLGVLKWSRAVLASAKATSSGGFAVYGMSLGLHLLQMSAGSIALTGILILMLWLASPTWSSLMFILTLALGLLGIKLLLNGIWVFLNDSNGSSDSLKRFWLVRAIVISLGMLAMFTALVHIEEEGYALKVSLTTRDLIDTLFMLALSLTVLPLWRSRKILLTLWQTYHQATGGLLVSLLTLSVPVLVALVSLLGLVGYINLGWNIAKHLSLLLLVLMGWLVISGLLTDLINWWKRMATASYQAPELWTDSLIPLVHKLLGLATVALAILVFSLLNGWYSDVAVRQTIEDFLNYSLLAVGGQPITVGNVLLSMFVLWLVFWLSGWSRQVSYQWVYQNISDTGVKHSLSVFTQYAVMLIGLLIALNIIGINLTTLTVFAGAIGVGIGFGLQNVINNFISGILLLVERPLRSGDTVNVANYYGKVGRIGIRSLTVETPEFQEVIIPNSEVISRTFVNWTSHNSLRRMTLYVNVSYDTNPELVLNILTQILQQTPKVLTKPVFKVYLAEFTDLAMKFRLDYLVDLKTTNFLQVDSEILSKVWEQFKAANIQIPTQQWPLGMLGKVQNTLTGPTE